MMHLGDPLKMIGQKLHPDQKDQKNRADDEADPGDRLQEASQEAFAYVAWPGEKLHKNIARQLPPQSVPCIKRDGNLRSELGVKHATFAPSMKKCTSV
jgi:hypothetical protein